MQRSAALRAEAPTGICEAASAATGICEVAAEAVSQDLPLTTTAAAEEESRPAAAT